MTPDNKVALVTGASSGFGAAIGRELAGAGYAVLAAGRDGERTHSVVEELTAAGGVAEAWVGDLADSAACHALLAATTERFGRLDLLVNNAGIIHAGTAEETSDENWHATLAVNTSAVFFLCRAAIPLLRAAGGGAIVNIASDWGLMGGERAVAYCASKGAVVLMTKALALDHAREGIRVNAVCPSECDTPMLEGEFRARGIDLEEGRRQAAEAIPLGRIGTPEEVAKLVAYLASEEAGFITGAAVPIDGGTTAR
jgi:2,3-dihydro-2,3-dihydroxybenzoate dehydrogenase